MNPAKRKKLARLAAAEAAKTQTTVTEEKPILKEEVAPTVEPVVSAEEVVAPVVEEAPAPVISSKKKRS